jgi:hypothetical protein
MAALIIQLKIYFLEEEADAFLSLIYATLRFLDRNRELSAYQKRSNQNFIRTCKQLFELKEKKSYLRDTDFNQKWAKIQQRIQTQTPLGNRRWLEEQIQALQTISKRKP